MYTKEKIHAAGFTLTPNWALALGGPNAAKNDLNCTPFGLWVYGRPLKLVAGGAGGVCVCVSRYEYLYPLNTKTRVLQMGGFGSFFLLFGSCVLAPTRKKTEPAVFAI